MPDPDFDGYYITWLDENGKEISSEWIFKTTYQGAVRFAALRIYQSPHMCPANVGGFFAEHVHSWRERHGQNRDKLGEMLSGDS